MWRARCLQDLRDCVKRSTLGRPKTLTSFCTHVLGVVASSEMWRVSASNSTHLPPKCRTQYDVSPLPLKNSAACLAMAGRADTVVEEIHRPRLSSFPPRGRDFHFVFLLCIGWGKCVVPLPYWPVPHDSAEELGHEADAHVNHQDVRGVIGHVRDHLASDNFSTITQAASKDSRDVIRARKGLWLRKLCLRLSCSNHCLGARC